jgi:arginyl-tRNA synthetase
MKQTIVKLLKKQVKLPEKQIENLIEIPPNPNMGDYSFPCFILSKKHKKSPNQIAENLRKKIKIPRELEQIQALGPYLNFFVNKKLLAQNIVKEILIKKDNYGKSKTKKQKVMVEFSQANTHKAFHIGHIRGTSLGESLARISEFHGDKVVRANYQGDTGMHVAKWIWCYKKYHSEEKLQKDESWIASIYVDAIKRLAKNEIFQEEVNEINKALEDRKDKKLMQLWRKTREFSLDSLEKIYSELNTHFNNYFFESQVEQRGKKISNELLKRKIAKKSQGAVIMNLEKYNLGVWVLLRSDGTALYSAKDLALADEKFKKFKIEKNIYVIGNEQDMHIRQLFKTLELMKFKQAEKCRHVSYGMVRLLEGKMSSRTGDNILYSDFMKEITSYAKNRIKERDSKIKEQELEKRALTVSIAAIKYSMLKQHSNKNIIFKKEDALSFEGDTGPYLQYSYARASSILKKAKSKQTKNFKIKTLKPKEIELTKKLAQFPEVVLSSYNNLNPSHIANYSYQLAKVFSEFYHDCPVINNDNEQFRLALVQSFRYVLKNSLSLLGINVLERM